MKKLLPLLAALPVLACGQDYTHSQLRASSLIERYTTSLNVAAIGGDTVSTQANYTLPDGTTGTVVKLVGLSNASSFFDCTPTAIAGAAAWNGKSGLDIDIYVDTPFQSGTSGHPLSDFEGIVYIADNAFSNDIQCPVVYHHGWNRLRLSRFNFTTTVGTVNLETGTFPRIRFKFNSINPDGAVTAYLSQISFGGFNRPKVCIMFDDGYTSVSTTTQPIMAPFGIPGTCAVISSLVGTSGKMDWSTLTTLHSGGWAMVNHTNTHGASPFLLAADVPTCQSEIQLCQTALISHGFTRDNEHLIFNSPYGEYTANYVTAAQNVGCLMFRGLVNTNPTSPGEGVYQVRHGQEFVFATWEGDNNTTLANLESHLDHVIAAGGCCIFLFHDIVASPSTSIQYSTANFTSFIQYCASKRGACDFVTEPGLYKALGAA